MNLILWSSVQDLPVALWPIVFQPMVDPRCCCSRLGGDDNNLLIKIPIGFTRLMYDKKVSNLYKTEPEPFLNNKQVSVVRGRVIGGCSSINGMVYTRGQRQDYDDWAALPGCEGWSYNELLPYFKRSEHYEIESDNPLPWARW